MWAVAQQHPEVVKVLLARGADVHARSDTWSQVRPSHRTVTPTTTATIPYGSNTPLMFAARVGDLESAKLLVAAGAKVNDVDAWGVSVMVLAAHSGFTDLVEFLLDKGADVERVRRRLRRPSRGDHAARRATGADAARTWRQPQPAAEGLDADAAPVERLPLRARAGGRDAVLAGRALHAAER